MANKKKYPVIRPKFIKEGRKVVGVYLDLDVYESIFEEMKDLKVKIKKNSELMRKNKGR